MYLLRFKLHSGCYDPYFHGNQVKEHEETVHQWATAGLKVVHVIKLSRTKRTIIVMINVKRSQRLLLFLNELFNSCICVGLYGQCMFKVHSTSTFSS
jgi:hypothetical protein